jgi:phosphoglycerate dehydrogenase-like enzyme
VNEAALADALKQGEIAGAATDVLTVEPPKEGNVLLGACLPNLIITPQRVGQCRRTSAHGAAVGGKCSSFSSRAANSSGELKNDDN